MRDEIKQILTDTFHPETLIVKDESHLHIGHPGAKEGGGHFAIEIIADAFEGKSPLERHRMVYDALADYMQQQIHAVKIKAKSPSEV